MNCTPTAPDIAGGLGYVCVVGPAGSHAGLSNALSWVVYSPTAPDIAGGLGYVGVVGPAGADWVDYFSGLSDTYIACLTSGTYVNL